jgi:hypothetical protein
MRDGRARLAGIHAAHDLRARLEHSGGVNRGLAARDALDDDLVVLVQKDRHLFKSFQALAS